MEALERLRIGGGAVRQELDGDVPAQAQVFGTIDDAHAAGAELGRHAIVRDRLANHGGGRGKDTGECVAADCVKSDGGETIDADGRGVPGCSD